MSLARLLKIDILFKPKFKKGDCIQIQSCYNGITSQQNPNFLHEVIA